MFTDPPYGVSYISRVDVERRKDWGAIANDSLEDSDLGALLRDSIPEAKYRFICCDWHCYSLFEGALGRPKAVCVWDKGHFGLGKGYRRQHEFVMFYGTLNRTDLSDMWPFSRDPNYKHPTQKPVALVAKALRDVAKRGAKIYDPFCGSGTTIIAAEQVGMVAHGVELEPKYCDVAVQRWEALTGKKAALA